MPDTAADTPPDHRPAIVICAWDAGETAWDPIEDLSGVPWSPAEIGRASCRERVL